MSEEQPSKGFLRNRKKCVKNLQKNEFMRNKKEMSEDPSKERIPEKQKERCLKKHNKE
jgi:hypothetical protein